MSKMGRGIIKGALAGLAILAGGIASAQTPPPQGPITLEGTVAEYQLRESAKPARELVPNWTVPKKLIVTVDKPERTAWLQQAMPPGVKVIGVKRESDAGADLADASALIETGCRADTFTKSPKLQWIHTGSGGSDQCLSEPRIARGEILLSNSQKVKNTILSEMALGYMFMMARSLDVALDNQRAGDINRRGGRFGKRLEGSTMLIVGLGGAGTEIGRIGHELGMKVIATRNSSREGPDFVSYVGLADELPNLIGQADVVIICAPLTPATRGLFNTAMLQRMKKDAMLINWTREEITPAEDLAAALKNGTIGSAALNWATAQPLTKDNPLWSAPNLFLAPWAGTGGGPEANQINQTAADTEKRWLVVRENMRRFATGDKMYSVFDLERGY